MHRYYACDAESYNLMFINDEKQSFAVTNRKAREKAELMS